VSLERAAPAAGRDDMKGRVLVVDDEPDMVANCERILSAAGLKTISTTDPHAALEALEAERPDLLLSDLKMPGLDGMQLLQRAKSVDPNMPVIIFTAFATIESAVAAVKEGAFDYLPKPFSTDQLRLAVGVPAAAAGAATHLPLPEAKARWMRELEVAYLVEQLNRHGGNISQAARAAGIDRKTFHRLINKYGIKS
jgi:DNA-binding NtrC family response regulator